jgi:hypothetical protein
VARAIKLSEQFVEIARREGQVMQRSIAAQVEFWARLGRQVEASGVLGLAGIRNLLSGDGNVQDLGESDSALYINELTRRLEALDGSDTRLLDELRAGGHSIATQGRDGNLIIEKPPVRAPADRRARSSPARG